MPYTTFSQHGVFGFIDWPLTALAFFKWFEILAVAGLVGFFGFWLFVLRPTLQPLPQFERPLPLRLLVRRRFAMLWGTFLGLVFVAANLSFGYQAVRMSGGSIKDAASSWQVLLFHTPLGWIWMVKLWVILLLLLLWMSQHVWARGWLALVLGLILCYSVSAAGHALDQGYVSWLFVADGLHVLAVSLWVGGLATVVLFGRPVLAMFEDREAHNLLTAWLERFSRVAAPAILILIVTGFYSAWTRIPTMAALEQTPYGGTAAFKLVLAGLTVGIGGLSRFHILPSLRQIHFVDGDELSAARRLRHRFFAFIGVEALIAILVVIVSAALLTQLPPPYWFVAQ